MGKNQTYKAMQRARLGSSSAGTESVEDGMSGRVKSQISKVAGRESTKGHLSQVPLNQIKEVKVEEKRKHRSRTKHSSSSSRDCEDSGGPVRLSKFFGIAKG